MRFAMMAMAAWCLAATAEADNLMSGSQLADACDGEPALVSGYVAGWLEKHDFDRFVMVNTMRNHMDDRLMRGAEKKMRGNVCMRDSATLTQATEALCRYLKDDPAARRQSAGDSLAAALSKTWPCPDSRDN